jgi:hypothetical protein
VVTFDHRVAQTGALAAPESVAPLILAADALDPLSARAPARCFDALILGVTATPVPDRRQLVVLFSAGLDTASFLDETAAIEAATRSPAAVFVVRSVINRTPRPTPEDLDRGQMPRSLPPDPRAIPGRFFDLVADVTGGTVTTVESAEILRVSDRGDITALRGRFSDAGIGREFLRALDAFRDSYVIRYRLGGVPGAGWHDVSVRVTRPGRYDVRTRKGWRG